jgi:hypothetical protein
MPTRNYTSDDYISAARRLRRRGIKNISPFGTRVKSSFVYDRIANASRELSDDLSDLMRSNYAYSFGVGSQFALDVNSLQSGDAKMIEMYDTLVELYSDFKAQATALSEYADQQSREGDV